MLLIHGPSRIVPVFHKSTTLNTVVIIADYADSDEKLKFGITPGF